MDLAGGFRKFPDSVSRTRQTILFRVDWTSIGYIDHGSRTRSIGRPVVAVAMCPPSRLPPPQMPRRPVARKKGIPQTRLRRQVITWILLKSSFQLPNIGDLARPGADTGRRSVNDLILRHTHTLSLSLSPLSPLSCFSELLWKSILTPRPSRNTWTSASNPFG